MAVNIKALFQHLMKDPDIVPPEGESKKDVAIALATQRAKQAFNNEKALNMAVQDRSISKLLAFLKADEDDTESVSEAEELKPEINRAEFNTHDYNFKRFQKRVARAKKRGKEHKWATKQQIENAAAKEEERTAKKLDNGDEISVTGEQNKADWEAAYDYLGDIDGYEQIANFDDEIERALSGEETEEEQEAGAIDAEAEAAGEEGKAIEDKADISGEEERPGQKMGESDDDYDTRMDMRRYATPETRKLDALRRAKALGETEDSTVEETVARHVGEAGDIEEKTTLEDKENPFAPHRFGEGVTKQQGYFQIQELAKKHAPEGMSADDFLGVVLDWNNRPVGSKGDPDHPLYDGLPGNNYPQNSHHDGGNPLADINVKTVKTMIGKYNEAKEDQARQASDAEGTPIEPTPPVSEDASDVEKLKGWAREVKGGDSKLTDYQVKLDTLLNKFKSGYAVGTGRGSGKSISNRNKKPEAAQAFDDMRKAWDDAGWEAKRENGEIDDSQYYEAVDKFVRENRDTFNEHYPHPKNKINESHIPDAPTAEPKSVLPTSSDTAKLMEYLKNRKPSTADATNLNTEVESQVDDITSGTGTAENRAARIRTLSDLVEEGKEQTGSDIATKPISQEEAEEQVATDDIQSVVDGEKPSETLESVADVVSEDKLKDLADALGLPKKDIPKSARTRKTLRDGGFDPDGEGLEHIDTPAKARDHVEQNTPEPAHVTANREREATAGNQRVQADRNREHKELVDKLRNVNTTDKEGAVKNLHDMGERHSPDGGGDAAVKRALDDLEGIAPGDPAGAANNPDMHRALGGTPEADKSSVERLSEYTSETPDAETPDVFEEDVRGRDLGARDNFNGKDVTLEHQTTDEETGIRHELWTNKDGEGVVRQIDESGAIIESADGGLNAIHDRYNKNLVTNELDPYTPTDTPELTEEAAEVAEEPAKETPPKKEPRKRAPRAKTGTPVEQLTDHVKESEEDAVAADAKREEEPTPTEGEEPRFQMPPTRPEDRFKKVTPDEGTPPPDDPPKTPEASDDEEDKRVPLAPVQPVSARESEALAEYQTPTPKPKEAVPRVDQGEFDMPDAEDTPAEEPAAEKPLTPKQKSSVKTATRIRDKAQESLDEQQAIHDEHKEAEEAARTKYEELDESRKQPDVTEAENFSLLDKMKEAEDAELEAQKGQRDAQGHMNRHQERIDNTTAQIERDSTPTEEVTPTEETSEETPTTESQPEPTEGTPEEPADAPADEGTGEDVGEPVGDEAPTPRAQRREGGRQGRLGLPRPRADEQRAAQPIRSPEQARRDEAGLAGPESTEETVTATTGEGAGIDRVTREVTPEERERREAPGSGTVTRRGRTTRTGRQTSFEDYEDSPEQAEAGERGERAGEERAAAYENIDMKRNELKTKFGMEDRFVDSLSDGAVHQKHEEWESKNNANKANKQVSQGFSKEDVLKAMAKADGREGDEDHLNTLRERHQFDDANEVRKIHRDREDRRAESAHSMKQDAAIAEATNMKELPDDVDSLHAENRLRDIVKKLDDHKQSHEKEGKPLLDIASVKNLKELTSDAVNKGDLSGEDMERIHAELNDMGHKFWDEDHQSQLDGEHESARLKHEEHMEHVSGPGGHEARVEAFDHSKAHELHHYQQDRDGNRGERTGTTYNIKDSSGKRERTRADSLDSAVDHLEDTKHPPKVPGLNDEEKTAQNDHFDLIKKGGLRSDDETATMKQLEQDNPFLHDPQYKAQVLGGNRHQLGGENGEAVMNNMNLSPDQQEEAQLAACQAPPGAMPPPSDDLKPKAWNPATHRWCDKEYLEGLQGSIGEGEGMLMPNGLHHGTADADLDKDAAGNVQGVIVTKDGVFKHHPPAKLGQTPTGPMGASDLAGHALSEAAHAADITGHGDKISKDIMTSTGIGHSATHGDTKTADKPPPPGPTALLNRKNKERAEKANAKTGLDRQMSRRDTEGSPLKRFLSGTMAAAKEGAIDVGGELPGYLGGGQVKGTEAWQKHQIRQATKTVQTKERAATKFRRMMDEVQQESS